MATPDSDNPKDYRHVLKGALEELEYLQSKVEALEKARTEPIAVIGIGCRFPGSANTADDFWAVLHEGVDAIVEIPPQRWDLDAYYDANADAPGRVYSRHAGLVDRNVVEEFAPAFFGIAPREAEKMDPQQRMLLEVCWEALEDAAVAADRVSGSRTGLFVGSCTDDYLHLINNLADPEGIDGYSSLGTARSITVGRVSYVLGLEGPAVQLDTACSSSLVAVHQACGSLRNGECEMALAGGVNLQLTPVWTLGLSKLNALSPDGRCKTFDAAANGFVRGEGCGIVVLKRLSAAIENGDRVLATVRGTAVNHDGRSSGLTVPNQSSQEKLLKEALRLARLEAAQIDYLEAHGTGTSLGDPIELGAVASVFGDRSRPLWVGSVKTNIGHLEGAAGIAGLIKVVLSLENQEIPPHLHFENPNPHIRWRELPVEIPTQPTPWPRGERRRLAAVSSFGFSGTNAHLILEEPPLPEREDLPQRPCRVVPISAKCPASLRALAARYASHVEANPDLSLDDVSYTAGAGRSHFAHRAAVVAETAQQARDRLRSVAMEETTEGVYRHLDAAGDEAKSIAFLFSGSGLPYVDMGRQLYETEPTFRAAYGQCEDAVLDKSDSRLNAEPALFALQYALGRLWQSWGVVPDVMLGRDVGEYAAACLAGVFSIEDALKLIATRGEMARAEENRVVQSVRFARPQVRLISSLTGQPVDGELVDPAYWAGHVHRPARFKEAIKSLFSDRVDAFLELGPDRTLVELARSCWDQGLATIRPCWLASLDRRTSDCQSLLNTLAQLYVAGHSIDWQAFRRGFAGRKISLPTYPFQRKRYWTEPCRAVAVNRSPGLGRGVHPLLGRRVYSASKAGLVEFESLLSASNPAYLAQHQVGHASVLPGTAFLEMALAAGRFVQPDQSIAIENVVFHRAMTLVSGQTRVVQTALVAESGGYRCDLFSRPDDEGRPVASPNWTKHASGHIATSTHVPAGLAVSLDELRGRCAEGLSPKTVYGRIAAQGLQYGRDFRSLRQVWRGPQEALGYVKLARDSPAGTNDYWFHPALLDGCLHVIAGMAETESNKTILPTQLKRMEVFARPVGQLFSHARLRHVDQRDGNANGFTVDIDLIDSRNALVARLEGLQMRAVDPSLLDGRGPVADGLLYRLQWRTSRPPSGRQPDPGHWLFLSDSEGVAERAAEKLIGMGHRCTLARPGPRYEAPSIEDDAVAGCRIRPEVAGDYLRLLDALTEQKESPTKSTKLLGVVHLWGATGCDDAVAGDCLSVDALAESHKLICESALHLMQALSSKRLAPPLWLVTRGGQPVDDGSALLSSLPQAPLWGLGSVIAAERPDLRPVRVDLDPEADAAVQAGVLIEELLQADAEDRIAYRRGGRFVARLTRLEDVDRKTPSFPEGAYLITGGLGALGLKVAEWFARRGATHIVLAGRSGVVTAEQTQSLELLQDLGANPRVIPADVSDYGEVARLLDSIKSDLPPLRGVIHAAGLLDDALLANQDWDRFQRVMAPKVAGAWNLHCLTEDLDFFVTFSSAVALLGSPGQANYAAANAFLDALAEYRRARGLPGLSIAWGPWADLGMTAGMNDRQTDRMRQIGLQPIAAQEGLELLEKLSFAEHSYVAAARVDWSRLASVSSSHLWSELLETAAPEVEPAPELPAQLRRAPAGNRMRMLTDHILGQVAAVVGADSEPIGPRRKLFDLGMDSLMSVELRTRLEKDLGVSLPLTLAFDYPNAEVLASHVFELLELNTSQDGAVGRPPHNKMADRKQPDDIQEHAERLAEMSDDEVKQLLADKFKDLL